MEPSDKSWDEFKSRAGRRRAWRALMIDDHGVLRKFYNNTHEIAPGKMWRSFQPSPADLRRWKARGVRTVLNLRGASSAGYYFLEKEACDTLGLNLVDFRVFSREAPSRDILYAARDLFESVEYPALMHCKSGADRAGMMAVLYKFFHEGRPLDEAMAQLSFKYGHVKQGKTGVIDFAFEKYLAYARQHKISLTSLDEFFLWVDQHYNHSALKDEFRASAWGAFLTDKILRRE